MEDTTALAKVLTVDNKMTRTEVIDLIMEEMAEELDAEIKQAETLLEELTSKTFSFEDVQHILVKARYSVNVDTYRYSNHVPSHTIGFQRDEEEVSIGVRDTKFQAHIKQVTEVNERLCDLRNQKHKMENNKRSFKSTVMKKVLEGSKEGQAILTQLGLLKGQLRKQLKK